MMKKAFHFKEPFVQWDVLMCNRFFMEPYATHMLQSNFLWNFDVTKNHIKSQNKMQNVPLWLGLLWIQTRFILNWVSQQVMR